MLRWIELRDRPRGDLDLLLLDINRWWMSSPWCAYSLHWDDIRDWPNPWDLLNQPRFCDLARGLGIMYTFVLMEHNVVDDAVMIETKKGNLVQVCGGKYILNYDPDTVLNTSLGISDSFRRSIAVPELKQQIR